MPIIDADDVPDDHNSFDERHITWNTHVKIREFFDYPQDSEFFGQWLGFFYSLSDEHKIALRKYDLSTLSREDFPQPFNPFRSTP